MRAELREALAADFWEQGGVARGTPHDLERGLSLAVRASVRRLDNLRPITIRGWLLRRGIRLPLDVRDRPLDGCIVAYRGQALVFLAAGLPPAWERLVLAHEVGHYLGHYEWPRRRVLRRLGLSVLPVLDGDRPPSAEEQLAGVLAGVVLEAHAHYMDRGFDPRRTGRTDRVERDATELACELLAPRQEVVARAGIRRLPAEPDAWERLLREEFAFPDSWAEEYAARLLRQRQRGRTFTDFLGL
jgi:hypothetical protein